MVDTGVTDRLAFAPVPLATNAVYVLLEYHFHVAPVPKVPPVCVRILVPPLHITGGVAVNVVGATDD